MKRLLFLYFAIGSLFCGAQDFKYNILFEGIGDNREFSREYALPQTILGARGAFELGVDIDEHKIRGGLSHLFEFGSELHAQTPKLTLYYQFQNSNKNFLFGAFPRSNKINFPLAMLSDTLLYYRPNIEGLLGEYRWNWGYQNGFVDWVGRQSLTQREQFMVGASGEMFYKNLFFQNYFVMFHNAHTKGNIPKYHIKDYAGFALLVGVRTSSAEIQGELKAGMLTSTYRERSVTNGYLVGNSLFAEVNARFKNFGIKSVISSGAKHNFAHGDSYYNTAKDYWRTDLIWYFINHKNVQGKFNLSAHLINWKILDQQQQLSIVYNFGK